MKLKVKMLPVKILVSLSLVAFGAINCKPSTSDQSADEGSELDARQNEDQMSKILAEQTEPCPNPNGSQNTIDTPTKKPTEIY